MNTYTYDEVYKETLKYFDRDTLATNVWISKYALKDQKGRIYELTPEDMHRRLAKEFSRIEQKYPNPISEDIIFNLLKDFKYIVPQGSPMFGIGNDFSTTSLSNCFVIGSNDNSDSYGSIMRTDEEQIQLMKRRGGVGHDISHLRPSGTVANNSILKGMAGSTLYMERYSNSTREVSQGDRRGALMLSIDIKHPDAELFIDKKTQQGKVTGANISVKISDEFMEAVKNDSDYIQIFPIDLDINNHTGFIESLYNNEIEYDKLYDLSYKNDNEYKGCYAKRIKAKTLWNKIIHNAWKSAEPGIMFWDTMIRESPADCYGNDWKSVSCNPCGEIVLCPYDSCRLLAINLYSYVNKPFTKEAKFDFEQFKHHVNIAQRMMDDLVDLEVEKLDKIISKIESDPEPEEIKRVELQLWNKIRQKAIEGRRTGLGITAEGDMLAALGLRYGTKEATEFATEVHKMLAVESYKSSIEMAKERGCFPIWDYKKEWENPFIKRIIEQIIKDFKWIDGVNTGSELQPKKDILESYFEYGRRNIANLTIAPTGSVSLMTQTTSGIEPVFLPYYKRRRKVEEKEKATFIDETGDMWEEYNVFHPKFIEWFRINHWDKIEDHLDIESPLQWLEKCHSSILEGYLKESPYYKATSADVDYLEKVRMQGEIQKWVDHSISVTVNMPENVSEDVVSQVYMKAHESGCKGVTVYREGSRSGVLISDNKKEKKESDTIIYNEAKKRPETLICDIYNISRNKQPYTIIVGKIEGKPYEIFVLEKFGNSEFSDKIVEGTVRKVKSKTYQLDGSIGDKKYRIDNIVEFMTMDEQKDTRKYSLMLRHGIKPKYIIEQIEEYANITSFDKVIAKVLTNYLNGEKLKGDEVCPSCGSSELRNESGCVTCQSCGWSKCS